MIYKDIPLVDGWVEFLNRENWDLFTTITFKKSTPCFSRYGGSFNAIKRYKYFFKHLNTYPNEFFSKFVSTFTVFERNPSRDGVHVHSLIRGIDGSRAESLQDKLTNTLGLSRVEPYDPSRNGKYYLCNKIIGNTLEHHEPYKINSAVREKNYAN